MIFREYESDRDLDSLRRIWREIGWTDSDGTKSMETALAGCRTLIAEIDGQAESFAMAMSGDLRYLDTDLSLSIIAGVGTSRVAKRQGLAGRLTAQAVARDVADGAGLASLGVFDQGFYNRLGFGNGPYITHTRFDPDQLNVEPARRIPCRLGLDDVQDVHASRLRRRRGHGSCNVHAVELTHTEFLRFPNSFGLGFRDDEGRLTHHLWLCARGDVEHGPYDVRWLAWDKPEQFLELMGLIKNLGDQVHGVRMPDPPGVQVQVLLDTPFKIQRLTDQSKFMSNSVTCSYVQFRICDVLECVEAARLPGGDVRFNLKLADPIGRYLPDDAPWRGVQGDYVITLGPSSSAERAEDKSLPTMTASVDAFTRLWLGVCPASCLTITNDLAAPDDLLAQLDRLICLPAPLPDWDY